MLVYVLEPSERENRFRLENMGRNLNIVPDITDYDKMYRFPKSNMTRFDIT